MGSIENKIEASVFQTKKNLDFAALLLSTKSKRIKVEGVLIFFFLFLILLLFLTWKTFWKSCKVRKFISSENLQYHCIQANGKNERDKGENIQMSKLLKN